MFYKYICVVLSDSSTDLYPVVWNWAATLMSQLNIASAVTVAFDRRKMTSNISLDSVVTCLIEYILLLSLFNIH